MIIKNKISINLLIIIFLLSQSCRAVDQKSDPVLSLETRNEIKVKMNEISSYVNKGQGDSAIKLMEEVVTLSKSDKNFLFLGCMYEYYKKDTVYANELFTKALKAYDSTLSINDKDIKSEVDRAQLIAFLYGKEAGIFEYEKLVKKYPADKMLENVKEQFYMLDRKSFINGLFRHD